MPTQLPPFDHDEDMSLAIIEVASPKAADLIRHTYQCYGIQAGRAALATTLQFWDDLIDFFRRHANYPATATAEPSQPPTDQAEHIDSGR